MEIRTNKPRDNQNTRIVPPPDKIRPRKKASQKLSSGPISGRRLVTTLKTIGKLCVLLLVGVILVSAFIYAYNANTFNLVHVRIEGCKELNAAQLEGIIRREFPANLLRIDLQKVKSRLEQETWIQHAEMRRLLPSDLIIYIQERTPSVILEMKEELIVADKNGILLGPYDPKLGKLDVPVFKGLMGDDAETYSLYQDENAARIRQALEMLAEIEAGMPQYARKISEVDVSERKNLKIILDDETAEIWLGETDYLKRFSRLINNPSAYNNLKLQHTEIGYIDLRIDHQIGFGELRQAKDESLKNQIARLKEQGQRNR